MATLRSKFNKNLASIIGNKQNSEKLTFVLEGNGGKVLVKGHLSEKGLNQEEYGGGSLAGYRYVFLFYNKYMNIKKSNVKKILYANKTFSILNTEVKHIHFLELTLKEE